MVTQDVQPTHATDRRLHPAGAGPLLPGMKMVIITSSPTSLHNESICNTIIRWVETFLLFFLVCLKNICFRVTRNNTVYFYGFVNCLLVVLLGKASLFTSSSFSIRSTSSLLRSTSGGGIATPATNCKSALPVNFLAKYRKDFSKL